MNPADALISIIYVVFFEQYVKVVLFFFYISKISRLMCLANYRTSVCIAPVN